MTKTIAFSGIYQNEAPYAVAYLAYLGAPKYNRRPMPREYGIRPNMASRVRKNVKRLVAGSKVTV
jgi:hypothetical protein